MSRAELPEGWRWAKLGDVCEIVNGSTPKSAVPEYWGGDICWVTPADLGQLGERRIGRTARSITMAGYDSCSTTLVPAGAVVMSSRAPIGHLAIAATELCTNQGCKSFVPTSAVESEYLYHALHNSMDDIRALGAGATFAEVSKRTLAAFSIPLPPVDEQRRIVARLEDQLATAERARAAALAQLAAVEAMPQALLRQIFPRSPADRLPVGWRWAKLGELCEMGSGGTPTRGNTTYFGGAIPWAIIGDLNDGVVSATSQTITDLGLANSAAKRIPVGALLIAMYGSIGKLGIAGVELTTNQAIAHVIPHSDLDTQWLFRYLRADRERLGTAGSGITQSNISQAVLKRWDIPVPPIDEQRRIVRELDEQTIAIERTRAAAQAQLDAIDALPAAALRLAFTP